MSGNKPKELREDEKLIKLWLEELGETVFIGDDPPDLTVRNATVAVEVTQIEHLGYASAWDAITEVCDNFGMGEDDGIGYFLSLNNPREISYHETHKKELKLDRIGKQKLTILLKGIYEIRHKDIGQEIHMCLPTQNGDWMECKNNEFGDEYGDEYWDRYDQLPYMELKFSRQTNFYERNGFESKFHLATHSLGTTWGWNSEGAANAVKRKSKVAVRLRNSGKYDEQWLVLITGTLLPREKEKDTDWLSEWDRVAVVNFARPWDPKRPIVCMPFDGKANGFWIKNKEGKMSRWLATNHGMIRMETVRKALVEQRSETTYTVTAGDLALVNTVAGSWAVRYAEEINDAMNTARSRDCNIKVTFDNGLEIDYDYDPVKDLT